ncbi:hypothetical protein E4U11_004427 [Claviceps purpurea]|nr:hypothetical protein E4U11_004427 [Claviceps purpurea]
MNVNTKADAGANTERCDRTGLSSKESHAKQKQLALGTKPRSRWSTTHEVPIQRHQVACDLSVHIDMEYIVDLS